MKKGGKTTLSDSSQKPVKIDASLWQELDKWLQTPAAKSHGFHSKAQFTTEAVRSLLQKYQTETTVYEKMISRYEKQKEELDTKGISSFSEYITFMLDEMIKKDKTFSKYAPKIEKITVEEDRIMLKDNVKNRIAEVMVSNGEIFCQLCNENDCVHVGYIFSIPEVYEILNKKGIKYSK